MDTEKLRILDRIIELSSLTRAAEEAGLTQSAVSHILAGLEKELGVTLLRRSRTGTRLTAEGEKLRPKIRAILKAEEELRRAAASLSGPCGVIRVATFSSVAVHWLPAMMQAFREQYPGVEFGLLSGDYHDVDNWLSSGEADIGFVTLPSAVKGKCVPLKEDRVVAVLPHGHRLAAGESVSVKELAREPFITLLETSDRDSRKVLEASGVKPKVRFTTKDDYAIIAMVGQGLGVSVMPELLLKGSSAAVETRPLDPPSSRTIALAVPAGDKAGSAVKCFAEFAAAWVEQNS